MMARHYMFFDWLKNRPSNSGVNTDGHNILRGSCPGQDSFFRFYKMSVDMWPTLT